MCKKAFQKTWDVLTTPKEISPPKLAIISQFSSKIFERLKVETLPSHTHVSLSTSACVEKTTEEGGSAAYWRERWEILTSGDLSVLTPIYEWENPRVLDIELTFKSGSKPSSSLHKLGSHLYDCWGRVVLSKEYLSLPYVLWDDPLAMGLYWAMPQLIPDEELAKRDASIGRTVGLIQTDPTAKRRLRTAKAVQETLGPGKLASGKLGEVLLLIGSGDSIMNRFGSFDVRPDILLGISSEKGKVILPLWTRQSIREYLPLRRVPAVLMALAEPGAKVRPLTKNTAWFVLIMKSMRFMIEPVMARDGRARIGLRMTHKMWALLKVIQKMGFSTQTPPIAQSSDYTAATDHIPLSLIQAIWMPIIGRIPKWHAFMPYSKLIFEKRDLTPLPSYRSVVDTTRNHECGSFMGEPLSFMTLTAMNLLFEEISGYYYSVQRPLWSLPVDIQVLGTRICGITGDDLASPRHDNLEVDLFNQVASDCGAILSEGKDGRSSRLMVFTEDHVLIHYEDGKCTWVYLDVVKTRLLTTVVRQFSDNRSSILGKGRTLTNQLDYIPNLAYNKRVMLVYSYIRGLTYRFTFEALWCPYELPPVLGGIGFPTDHLSDHTRRYLWFIWDKLSEKPIDYWFFLRLRGLNNYRKYGSDINEDIYRVISRELKGFEFRKEIPPFDPDTGTVTHIFGLGYKGYSLGQDVTHIYWPIDAVEKYIDLRGGVVPIDRFGQKDREVLSQKAWEYGLMPVTDWIDQYQRGIMFNAFVTTNVVKSQLTLNDWVRRVGRFWRPYRKDPANVKYFGKSRVAPDDLPRWQVIERKVQSLTWGYVTKYRGLLDDLQVLPTMAVRSKTLDNQGWLALNRADPQYVLVQRKQGDSLPDSKLSRPTFGWVDQSLISLGVIPKPVPRKGQSNSFPAPRKERRGSM